MRWWLIILALLVTHAYMYRLGVDEVTARWNEERLLFERARNAQIENARRSEQTLQEELSKTRQEAADEKRRIAARYERTIAGLRQRPEARAPTGVPEGAAAGVGCTGAGLARNDGQFLARYAADAARLQSDLQTCVNAYNSARRQVNGE